MVLQVDSSSVLNTPSSVASSSSRVGMGNPPVELALKTSPDNHLGTSEESVYTSAIPESLEDNLLQVGGWGGREGERELLHVTLQVE